MYEYYAELERVIDGDTAIFTLDLGFNTKKTVRLRFERVDTAEIHFVSHDSDEYELGMKHTKFVEHWLNDADSLLVSTEEKGKYGRWLGEIYDDDGNCLNDALLDEFDVEY